MPVREGKRPRLRSRGMVMPVVLVLMAALLVLALAAASLTRVGRHAARTWVHHTQSQLAVRSGMEEVAQLLHSETSNDDFLVMQAMGPSAGEGRKQVPYGFIASGEVDADGYLYRYRPLFSSSGREESRRELMIPEMDASRVEPDAAAKFSVFPWLDPVSVEWRPMLNDSGEVVARYAYWVEDLQARLDPQIAGNARGDAGEHVRPAFPFPAPGVHDPSWSPQAPCLSQVAMYALSPGASWDSQGELARRLIRNRGLMVSPESVLAAAEAVAPLKRVKDSSGDAHVGGLIDPSARAVEESLLAGLKGYREQACVPHLSSIDPACAGKPKLNLNRLLAAGGDDAVTEMADWIGRALPQFEQRKGGFPDDYLKTLAANALDYADEDSRSTLAEGEYVGVDSYPFLSEIVLHIHFQKLIKQGDRWVLKWKFRLFAELWNMSTQPIEGGEVRLSYEVNLKPTPMGVSGAALPFDDPGVLDDPSQSTHRLEKIGGSYYTPAISVQLMPDEYRFYEFATVDYTLDFAPQLDGNGQPYPEAFALAEPEDGARGMTLLWDGAPVQRIPRIIRDAYGLSRFRTDRTRKAAKACIPGLNYGGYGEAVNNMGDPRIAPYLRVTALGENAYPENVSPHRRNIRRRNIYDKDPSPLKTRHYGRVLPSQWPDGGHDSVTGEFLVTTSDAAVPTDPDKWPLDQVPLPLAQDAPQRISNAGRFYSAAELGRVYDPVLWLPAYADLEDAPGSGAEDTEILIGQAYGPRRPAMPVRRMSWPEVSESSIPSLDHGGGNTLRLGRPEHGKFDRPGWRATGLLDLFHAGIPGSEKREEREGALIEIRGQVNVNTAGRDVLRCLAAGKLRQDPGLCRVVDWSHEASGAFRPHLEPLDLGAPSGEQVADAIADAIIRHRPYASRSQLAHVEDDQGRKVFGNPDVRDGGERIQWSDAAAEEVFARVYESSTVRSRNFRVWVVGQAMGGNREHPGVLSESRRVFTVFADPGERKEGGALDPSHARIRILYERAF